MKSEESVTFLAKEGYRECLSSIELGYACGVATAKVSGDGTSGHYLQMCESQAVLLYFLAAHVLERAR